MKKIFQYLKSKPKRSIFFFLVVVLIIFLFAKNKNSDAGIVKYTVTRGDVVDSLELAGKVEPIDSADMAFTESGQVARVYKKNGDTVKKGERIMELDNSSLYADLKDAMANLALVKGGTTSDAVNLDLVQKEQDTLVSNAYKNLLNDDLQAYLDGSDDDLSAEISGSFNGKTAGEYRLEVYSATGSSGLAFRYSGIESGSSPLSFNSPEKLGTKGLYIKFDDTSAGYGNSKWVVPIPNTRSSNYTKNLNAYNSALSTRDVEIAKAKALLESGSFNSNISEAKIAQAQARVDKISSEINSRTIIAPFDGIVSKVELKTGEIATSLETVAEVLSPGVFEITVEVPEVDIVNLVPGLSADITLDAYGEETIFKGKILSIDPSETKVDGVSVYKAKVIFDEADPRIISGFTANVTIEKQKVENVLFVPERFIEKNADGIFVNILRNEKTEKIPVIEGLKGSNSFVEIRSGLAEGDIVVGDFTSNAL